MKVEISAKEYTRKMKELAKIIRSSAWKKECADFVINMIRTRTKLGYGVSETGGTKKKLKALSPSYKKFRKLNPPKGEFATPDTSNLTNTGSMLNSITGKITSEGIQMDLKNNEEREKAMMNSINGRDFMLLSKAEQKQLEQFMKKRLLAEFKKI